MTPTWVIAVVILRTAAADEKQQQQQPQQQPVTGKSSLPEMKIVSYNWARITFTWIPSNTTRYNVCRIVGGYPYYCQGEYTGSGEFNYFDEYSKFVLMENGSSSSHGSSVIVASYNVAEIHPKFVKPDGVSDLKVWNVTPLSALVTWTSPKRELLFRLKVTNLIDGNSATVGLTNLTRFNLTNLSPSTTYNASVDCRPLFANGTETGFWSEHRTLQLTTSDDVPAAGPPVTAGSFRIDDAGEKRDIEVFWQEIPAGLRNGIIVATRVTCCSTGNCSSVNVSGDMFNTTLRSLAKDVDYNITISSRTSAGFNNSLTLEPILIAKDRNKCAHLGAVGVIDNNSEISVRWFPCPGAVRYTVYWYNVKPGSPPESVQTQWRTVSGSETSLTVGILQHPWGYWFAMSVEHNTASGVLISSGMTTWSSCLHYANAPPPKPDDFRFACRQSANSLTVEWLKPTGDCRNTGYISHYVLQFCRQTTGCDDDAKRQVKIVANVSSYVIQKMDADDAYIVRAKICSDHAESEYAEYICRSAISEDDNIDIMHIVWASTAVSVILALILTILCLWVRKLKILSIQITPPKHDEHFGRLSESIISSETSSSSSSSPSDGVDIAYIKVFPGLAETAVDIRDALPVSCDTTALVRRQLSSVSEIESAEGDYIPIGTCSTSAQNLAETNCSAKYSAKYVKYSSSGDGLVCIGPVLTLTTPCLNADKSLSSTPVSVQMMLYGSNSDDEGSATGGSRRMVDDADNRSLNSASSSQLYRAASLLDDVESYSFCSDDSVHPCINISSMMQQQQSF